MGHHQSKAIFWANHIKAWRISGKRQADYCAEHKLGIKAFGRWVGVFKKKPELIGSGPDLPVDKQYLPTSLIPLSIAPDVASQSGSGLRICTEKYKIDLAVDFDPDSLKRLLRVLEGA